MTVTLADAWLDACPIAGDANDVPEGEYGTAYEECFDDGTYWLHVDWDNYPNSWVSEEEIDDCCGGTAPPSPSDVPPAGTDGTAVAEADAGSGTLHTVLESFYALCREK